MTSEEPTPLGPWSVAVLIVTAIGLAVVVAQEPQVIGKQRHFRKEVHAP
jgi:hypothetical protein